MIRKFNYTGRKRIERDRVQITLVPSPHLDQPPSFDASIKLEGLDLSYEAAVYVEVSDKSSYMRFDFGTVDKQIPPQDRQLVDLQSRDIFSFRVKIVGRAEAHGKVLAVADRLPPIRLDTEGSEKESLLAVSSEDLQDQIWRLDFSKELPVLVLNSRLEDLSIRELVRSDHSVSTLILPSVFRQVLAQILIVEREIEHEEDSWQSRWLKFTAGLGAIPEGLEVDKDSESVSEWIDQVALPAFCRHIKASDRFRQARPGDEER